MLLLKCKQMKQHDNYDCRDCSNGTFSPIIVKWKVDECLYAGSAEAGEQNSILNPI